MLIKMVNGEKVTLTDEEEASVKAEWVANDLKKGVEDTARAKAIDIKTKRDAAIEEILMAGTSVEATAYQNAL